MKELLSKLKQELTQISSKTLSPDCMVNRGRTRLERLLFLIAKEYCQIKFGYDLGGLTYYHQKSFDNFISEYSNSPGDIGVVKSIFTINRLISELTSSDPYIADETMSQLGGTTSMVYTNIKKRIDDVIFKIEESC